MMLDGRAQMRPLGAMRHRTRYGRVAIACAALVSTALLYGSSGSPERSTALASERSSSSASMPRWSTQMLFDEPVGFNQTVNIVQRNYDVFPSADGSAPADEIVVLMADGSTKTLDSDPWTVLYSSTELDYGRRRKLFSINGEMVDEWAVYYNFDDSVLAAAFPDGSYEGVIGFQFSGEGQQMAYFSIQLYVTDDDLDRRRLDNSVDQNADTTVLFFGTLFDKDCEWSLDGEAIPNPFVAGNPSITAYTRAAGLAWPTTASDVNGDAKAASSGSAIGAAAPTKGRFAGVDVAAALPSQESWTTVGTFRMSKEYTIESIPDGVSGLDTCADTYLYTENVVYKYNDYTRFGYMSFTVPYVFDASDPTMTTFETYDLSYFSVGSNVADSEFTVNMRMMAALFGTTARSQRGNAAAVFLLPYDTWEECAKGHVAGCAVTNEYGGLEAPHVVVDGKPVGYALPYGNVTVRYRDLNAQFPGSPDLVPCHEGSPDDPNEPANPAVMWDATYGRTWLPREKYKDYEGGWDSFYADVAAAARAAVDGGDGAPTPVAPDAAVVPLSVNTDKQKDWQTADCVAANTTQFPSVLQAAAGFVIGGKPWGGILLTDRGQYQALHGLDAGAAYDPAESYARLIASYDAAWAACQADASQCEVDFDSSCRLMGDYDATLDCVEDCVESEFRSFVDPDYSGPSVKLCSDPVLAAFEVTPSLIKSCMDPTYDATEGGRYTITDASPGDMGCYDCISVCVDKAVGTKRELYLESDCGDSDSGH